MVASKGRRQRWQGQQTSSCCCKRQRVAVGAAVVAAVMLALLPHAAAQPLPAARASLKAARSIWTAAAAQTQAAAVLPVPSLPPPMPADGKVGLDEADIVREMSSIVHDNVHEALEWFEYPPLHNSNGETNLMVRARLMLLQLLKPPSAPQGKIVHREAAAVHGGHWPQEVCQESAPS